MLLGFNSFFFTTTEARAQAGGEAQVPAGGGNRGVNIDVTSDTPGITVTGPIENGFDEGVSAFLVEFTPTALDDTPPPHANVSINITPADGWTLQQPDPATPAVVRQTPRGDFAAPLEWAAGLFVEGQQEDSASGKVEVVWPWAEFDLEVGETVATPGSAQHRAGGSFRTEIGFTREVKVTINVVPEELPDVLKNAEAEHWYVGWVNNLTSLGTTCYYPHKYKVVWWDTTRKESMPIFDSTDSDPLWYHPAAPCMLKYMSDGQERTLMFSDHPLTDWAWVFDAGIDPNPAAYRATRALQVDAFRAWVVAARGQGDPNVIEWLRWMNWSTDLRVDTVAVGPHHPDPWDGMDFSIDKALLTIDSLFNGKGRMEPEIVEPEFNDIFTKVPKNYDD